MSFECINCDIFLEKLNNELISFKVYKISNLDVIVLLKGKIENQLDVPCRIHSGCITGDLFGSKMCDCGKQLDYMFSIINKHDNGILIYITEHEGRGIGIFNKIKAYKCMQDEHIDTFQANKVLGFADDLRDFSYINNILEDLKLQSIILYSNNPEKYDACKTYISHIEPIPNFLNQHNFSYLVAKQTEKHHNLKLENYDNIQKDNILINTSACKIGILYTKWNEKYVNLLKDGAYNKLISLNFNKNNIEFLQVPGAYDLLAGLDAFISRSNKKYDAVLLIGILLKGETSHYEFLMNALSSGLYNYQAKYGIPVINGILTCENEEQIKYRTINNNHGIFWANAILDLVSAKYVTQFDIEYWNKFNNTYVFLIDNNLNIHNGKYKCLISSVLHECHIQNHMVFIENADDGFATNKNKKIELYYRI